MQIPHIIQIVLFVVGVILIAVMVHWANSMDDPMKGSPDGNIVQAYISLALSALGVILIGIALIWFIIGWIIGL